MQRGFEKDTYQKKMKQLLKRSNKYKEVQTNVLWQRNLIRYLTSSKKIILRKKKKSRNWIIENVIKKRIKSYIQYLFDRYLDGEQSVKYWKAG